MYVILWIALSIGITVAWAYAVYWALGVGVRLMMNVRERLPSDTDRD